MPVLIGMNCHDHYVRSLSSLWNKDVGKSKEKANGGLQGKIRRIADQLNLGEDELGVHPFARD